MAAARHDLRSFPDWPRLPPKWSTYLAFRSRPSDLIKIAAACRRIVTEHHLDRGTDSIADRANQAIAKSRKNPTSWPLAALILRRGRAIGRNFRTALRSSATELTA
jgi:hypothetical protein